MRNIEQPMSPDFSDDEQSKAEQVKKTRLISRYIAKHVIGENESLPAKEEKEIQEYYQKLGPRERADTLYNKMMAYMMDKQVERARKQEAEDEGETFEPEEIDPYLISEIKVLSSDPKVKELLPDAYGEARLDEKGFRSSEISALWKGLKEEIEEKEERFKALERELHLHEIKGRAKVSSAKSRLALLSDNLAALEQSKKNIETLEGLPKTPENTDAAARFQYELLKKYASQLKQGFVWLPSRKRIHQETVSEILNYRWPVLIGEAGSGKSQQADAAALELTGFPPTEIECEATTGEKQLIVDKDIDPETGGSFDNYGPLMQAFTGYEDSRQKEPLVPIGRIARFDESGRLGNKAYSIIKKARQKKPGDDFYGRKVLAGSGAIWTSNPVGPRYPDRHTPDPAMRRELAEISVDYPDMSTENPELYEFALSALFDENNHIAVAKQELTPAYQKKNIAEDQREVLNDGSIVIAKDEILADLSDMRHGALWRFTGAIKALQDSFVYGNAEAEKYPDTLLRYKEDEDGKIEIATDGSGELLTLSSSTVTLGELGSWMSGFNERRQKQNIEFHTDTLTEWLNFKVDTYLKQADKADKEKIKAIFNYFGFLEKSVIPEIENVKPLTPKEIGYLSPRVPRPVYLEKPVQKAKKKLEAEKPQGLKEYETNDVLLEDGNRVLISNKDLTLGDDEVVGLGRKFRVQNNDFALAGIVEDENHKNNGQPVGKFASGEDLYRIFKEEEIDLGMLTYFKEVELGATGVDDFKQELIDTWSDEGCLAEKGSFMF